MQPTLGMSSSTVLQLIKGTTLVCHRHASTTVVNNGRRYGDELVFESEDNWLDELEMGFERLMIWKRPEK